MFKGREESQVFQVPRERRAYRVWTVARVFLGCREQREALGRQAPLERSDFRGFLVCLVHLDKKARVAQREMRVSQACLERWDLLAKQVSVESRERWALSDPLVNLEI